MLPITGLSVKTPMVKITNQALLGRCSKPIMQLQTSQQWPDKKKTHHIRVCIKRLLARLQLLEKLTATEPPISGLVHLLKQLSQHLATTRDRDVMVILLKQLTKKTNIAPVNGLLNQTRELLLSANPQPTIKLGVIHSLARDICTSLQTTPQSDIGAAQVQHYLHKKWRHIGSQYGAKVGEQEQEKLHKLRKKLKCLSYQYEVLEGLKTSLLLPVKQLAKLGTKLGKVHDLFVLESYLRNQQQLSAADIHAYNGVYTLLGGKRVHLLRQSGKLFKQACKGKRV